MLRAIQRIRRKVSNKARVEGCIVEAQLVEEATHSMSLFFKSKVHSARNKPPRYDNGSSTFNPACEIEIFQQPSRCFCLRGCRDLSIEEYKAAFLYILTNIPEMEDLLKYVFSLLKWLFKSLQNKNPHDKFSLLYSKFDQQQWKGTRSPTEHEITDLRMNGWKPVRGSHIHSGPNLFDWFKSHVNTFTPCT
jgi:hypothetical protein